MRTIFAAVFVLVAVTATPVKAEDWWNTHHPHFAWCGAWMRDHVGKIIGEEIGPVYNRAIEWAHFGSPAAGPAPGTIVVWPHHVGMVVHVPGPGKIVAISGNDGHRVRVRERSTKGIVAYRWPDRNKGGYTLASIQSEHTEAPGWFSHPFHELHDHRSFHGHHHHRHHRY